MPTSSSCEGQCWVLPPLEFFMTSVILTGGIRNASGHRRLKLLFPTPCIIRSTKKSAKNPIYMVAVFWISPKKNMVLWACKVLAGVLGWKSAFSAKSRYKWCRWHQDMPRNSESTPKNQYPPPGWMMDYDGWGLPVAWYLQLWGVQISEFCWGGFVFWFVIPKTTRVGTKHGPNKKPIHKKIHTNLVQLLQPVEKIPSGNLKVNRAWRAQKKTIEKEHQSHEGNQKRSLFWGCFLKVWKWGESRTWGWKN